MPIRILMENAKWENKLVEYLFKNTINEMVVLEVVIAKEGIND
ncbi:hypothetical protein [Psychrobacillus sp. L4]